MAVKAIKLATMAATKPIDAVAPCENASNRLFASLR